MTTINEDCNNKKMNDDEFVKSLTNPDKIKINPTFDWEHETQQLLIGAMVHDLDFLLQTVGMVKPEYFTDQAHRYICEIITDYHQTYKVLAPSAIISDAFGKKVGNSAAKDYFFSELGQVINNFKYDLYPKEYLLDQVTHFAKVQAVRLACLEVGDLLKSNDSGMWDKAYDTVQKAFQVDRNIDLGQSYFEDYEARYLRMHNFSSNGDRFTSGFVTIDNNLTEKGYRRGNLAAVFGASGVGKSFFLIHVAIANLNLKHKVLYITLELDEDSVAKRIDAQLADVPLYSLADNKIKVFGALKENFDENKILKIKQFPAGSANLNTIRAYLSQLELYGFKPDLVVVDYIGEFQDCPGMKTYESRERIVRDLRGLAVEKNMFIFTAAQANRGALDAQKEGAGNNEFLQANYLSDSIGQKRPLDALYSINMSPQEDKANIARIGIDKHRDGKGGFAFPIEIDPNTRKMMEINETRYSELLSSVKVATGDETTKNIKPKKKKKKEDSNDDDEN